MIKILSTNISAYSIVEKALLRSHGQIKSEIDNIYCFISPSSKDEELIKSLILENTKILILGKISNNLAELIGLVNTNQKIDLNEISFDHDKKEDTSNLKIKYCEHQLNSNNPLTERCFFRFDFTNEWNNLGYGTITNDNSIWSLSQSLNEIDAQVLAHVYDDKKQISVFASLKDFDNSSILYINREVGLVDGLDWVLVEDFFNVYRCDKLPSLPLIIDIPQGYDAVVSSRLDCDQSIINSRPLVELYKKYNINISLAISTGIKIEDNAISFLNSFYDNGGAILSHTVNHYTYWGDNYQIAYEEALNSKKWLENNVNNLNELKYAVSPFHSNQPYSIQALSDSGYRGFISGIIHNDPAYLVSVSGKVSFVTGEIVTHSQQCMLHGDCYHRANNSLDVYKSSFDNHYKSKKMFGYLDHPFGEYDYGWKNEEERLNAHEEFLCYINSFYNVKWMTADEVLDFVIDKASVEITITNEDKLVYTRKEYNSIEKVKIMYKNNEYTC